MSVARLEVRFFTSDLWPPQYRHPYSHCERLAMQVQLGQEVLPPSWLHARSLRGRTSRLLARGFPPAEPTGAQARPFCGRRLQCLG
jgi:hypothetical protein